MFGSIWSFIKRHRRKFIFVGVLFGGAVLVGKYAKRKMLEYQEREASDYLKQLRKQHHFDSNQRNCNTTVLSLIPRLRETVCRLLDSEALTSQLKSRPANKMEIWEELKILSFTRTIVALYSGALLALFLRVQLNILGGYMYQDTLGGRSEKAEVATTSEVQKQYLAMVHYLFEQGLSELITVVRNAVHNVLANTSLKDSMSAVDVRVIFTRIRQEVEASGRNGYDSRTRCGFGRFVVSSADNGTAEACHLTSQETFLRQLENETRDVVDGEDFNCVMKACLDNSFHLLVSRMSEYFKPLSATNGIVSMAGVSMPLAKVIPIVNGLVYTVLTDPPNPIVQDLLLQEQVKDFAVNIYDAFSEPSSVRTASNQ